MLNLLLFGPPGSGKGTQAEFLVARYKLTHISTGELLRSHIKAETEIGLEARLYIDKGFLAPDSLVINLIKETLLNIKNAQGFIFDGFPRTVTQANALDDLLTDLGMSINGMLCLSVDKHELVSRLTNRGINSGRADDQDVSVIENRIMVYHEKTEPIKAFYQVQQKYHSIDGTGTINEITQRLVETIATIQDIKVNLN